MKSSSVCWLIVMWMVTIPYAVRSQQSARNVYNDIRLQSIYDNSIFTLKQVDAGLVAIVFISPECPLSQNYMLTLNKLQQNYAGKLTVMGIFPGTGYTNAAYLAFEKKYQVIFQLFRDEEKLLAGRLKATITPEVFLMNSSHKIIYSGAIDDWVVSLGKMRKTASDYYLKNAIELTLAGLPPQKTKTKAIGCFIN